MCVWCHGLKDSEIKSQVNLKLKAPTLVKASETEMEWFVGGDRSAWK